ncbi:hypothetical protein VNI00_007939 [Paramarasmius palmivorus]|uniref:Uncharacterized protein n=1 Tax=Paramarasmius palmivorus TaxID=297713 RepID=A0AAW0CVH5_9AGAR
MFSILAFLAFAGATVASGIVDRRNVDLTSTYTDWNAIRSALVAKGDQHATSSPLRPFAAAALPEPDVPAGYELAFGPLNASSSAPGYMGFVFIDSYDPEVCSDFCKVRDFDATGGLCQFFNLYQATVNKNSTTFTCALYFLSTDNSTATNTGDATVTITESRGYRRISAVENGTFETLACTPPAITCSATNSGGWVGTTDTAVIVHDATLAHFGSGAVSLGSLSGNTTNSGKISTPVLHTTAGLPYALGFFHTNTLRNAVNASSGVVNVTWNGIVIDTLQGASNWTFHGYTLDAKGNDTLAFVGGRFPAYDFIDDVFLFSLVN